MVYNKSMIDELCEDVEKTELYLNRYRVAHNIKTKPKLPGNKKYQFCEPLIFDRVWTREKRDEWADKSKDSLDRILNKFKQENRR